MRSLLLTLLFSLSLLAACSEQAEQAVPVHAPLVKTVTLAGEIQSPRQGFSGTVRARSEIPIAFEVPGRISQRHVDAGQTVIRGQRLFTLDARDLEQNRASAEAALNAAEAELEVARADLVRHRHLIDQNTISQQAFERVQLGERAAASRVQVAQAQLQQARIALDHTELRAKSAGVLMDVSGEPGQVVNPGQPLATLADASQLEIELYLPDGFTPPQQGEVYLGDGKRLPLQLREVAGAADEASRSWRVRYQVAGAAEALKLGSVVRVNLALGGLQSGVYTIPIAALDERGGGPQVWQVVDGKVQPVAVEVLALERETARIATDLAPGTTLVALGTHLLIPDMAVRERP